MSWFDTVLPYAQQAGQALNMPVSVILAQWGLESDEGKSRFATEGNNLGGIKYVSSSMASGYMTQGGSGAKFAKYSDLGQFTQDYIRVMSLGYYRDVRDAVSVSDTLIELSESPYDAGHYSGGKLVSYYNTYSLSKYDNMGQSEQSKDEIGLNLPLSSDTDKRFLGWFIMGVGMLIIIKALGGDTGKVKEVADYA